VDDGVLAVNPAIARNLVPKLERRQQRVLSKAETKRLLAATAATRYGALWNLLLYTGLRPGEALGLTWDDVSVEHETLRVQRALVPQKRDASGRTWRLEEPKTATSRRAVPLLPATVEALRWHRTRQEAERLVAGAGYRDLGFVFADERGEPLRADVVYKVHFRRACRMAGVPGLTLYQCRHSAATLMLEAGVPLKVVQERLGHATITLTADTYSHVSASLQQRAVEEFAAYMEADS
jgi:integrase